MDLRSADMYLWGVDLALRSADMVRVMVVDMVGKIIEIW